MLFALSCPPNAPLWQCALGIAVGLVIGKEIFGGVGMNIFNPALMARAFLYFTYPVDISGADKAPEKSDYFFGTVNENRFEMMVGRDFKLKNYNNGLINLFIYPIVEIDDQLSKNFSKEFYYKNI